MVGILESRRKDGVHHIGKESVYFLNNKLWINAFLLFVFCNVAITKVYMTRNRGIKIITPSTKLATLFSHLSASADGDHSYSSAGNIFTLKEGVVHLDCSLVCELKGLFKVYLWASLVAQWLGIRLPMQGTWVRALVREDPTCHGATKPVLHNY